jgi:hypothetical protein
MSQRPEIGEIQLHAWRQAARGMTLYIDQDGHARCGMCEVSVWRIRDDSGNKYTYTEDMLLALKVAHLRQCHSNLEHDIYQEAGIPWLI